MTTTESQTQDGFEEMLRQAWQRAGDELSMQLLDNSHWTGQLSTSALSTATAISALVQMRVNGCLVSREVESRVDAAIVGGCQWLEQHQNADGGFGDTDRSHSNIATTFLVLAAWELAGRSQPLESQVQSAWGYVQQRGSWDGLRARYGKDKTFVVPILSNCALAGFVPWKQVAALPFEAAWLPQEFYRWARMPVVSYAVPALVAIGQATFHHCPPRNPLLRALRSRAIEPTLGVLRRMQPASGGYLEAVPLTSFVLMNLAAVGNGRLPVAGDCLKFLLDSRLADGSWPIDTNLATWVTSLSIDALARGSLACGSLACGSSVAVSVDREFEFSPTTVVSGRSRVSAKMVRWLLSCQHKQRHPFTGANPGGWGWTDLSGAVPDADDTPAALLALHKLDLEVNNLGRMREEVYSAVAGGLRWLCRLQNRDGGMPTFCRGWGKLPFDRSGTDLTAHAIRAIHAWLPQWELLRNNAGFELPTERQLGRCISRGFRYLERHQAADGSWLPLWFGNQDRPDEENPVYGTGRVLLAYADLGRLHTQAARRGVRYLEQCQNADGGWGGGPSVVYKTRSTRAPISTSETSSIEETAIALQALLACGGHPRHNSTIMPGLELLAGRVLEGNLDRAWPIGFYFAKLWYHESLYPTIFSLGALGAALARITGTEKEHVG